MQEAGGDAVLETAFTLADGLEYCRSGTSSFQAFTDGSGMCWIDSELEMGQECFENIGN